MHRHAQVQRHTYTYTWIPNRTHRCRHAHIHRHAYTRTLPTQINMSCPDIWTEELDNWSVSKEWWRRGWSCARELFWSAIKLFQWLLTLPFLIPGPWMSVSSGNAHSIDLALLLLLLFHGQCRRRCLLPKRRLFHNQKTTAIWRGHQQSELKKKVNHKAKSYKNCCFFNLFFVCFWQALYDDWTLIACDGSNKVIFYYNFSYFVNMYGAMSVF